MAERGAGCEQSGRESCRGQSNLVYDDMGPALVQLGLTCAVLGVAVEFVAFFGIAFYPVRRALPVKSPIQWQSLGCLMFCGGVLLIIAGRLAG